MILFNFYMAHYRLVITFILNKGIIKRGMRWQVGSGNKIRLWRDKWVPRLSTYKVFTPEKQISKDALVCELINKVSNEWDIGLLCQWFLLEDRDAILGIPVSTTSTSDRLVWVENKCGKFIVKSAYTLALEGQKKSDMADCSNDTARRKLWKAIWKLHLPQKIKHFTWKASRDILASKENLAKRKITPNGVCELCGGGIEKTGHTLWFCEHAKEVWKCSKLALPFEISTWKFLDVEASQSRG